MTSRQFGKTMVWARRAVQIACLALFLHLFWAVRFYEQGGQDALATLFFDIDPLILIGTWLAAHAVPVAALLALITLGVTVVFGRVFCGWVCPLGTLHHFASWLGQKLRRGKPNHQPYSRWQKSKYYLLIVLLVMALLGAHWIGVFDPIAQLYRVTATFLYPATQYAFEKGATAVYHTDPHIGDLHLTSVTEPVYKAGREHIFVTDRQTFLGSTLIGSLFVAALLLNLLRTRFWCRYICPLGGLLGWFSQRQVLRLHHPEGACKECTLCGKVCPAGATPETPGQWRASECFGCWNCTTACNFNAVTFRFGRPWRAPSDVELDLGKRATLAAGVGGIVALLLFRQTPQAQARTYNPAL
ncbi:MAG TPA: 4Fe-4S binding protein, partial [Candidatus Hydrogenedentes bacterium]|nr:4Fe-4S binding protein [Candidatus Hydrogenedentota bacterium]